MTRLGVERHLWYYKNWGEAKAAKNEETEPMWDDPALNSVWSYYHLGKVLVKEGQILPAVACYEKCIELQPDFVKAYYELIQIQPDRREVYLQLASVLERQNQWERTRVVASIAQRAAFVKKNYE